MSTAFKDNLICLQEIDSTNLEAFRIGKRCAVCTQHQTSGKGRLGRSFNESVGESLLFTAFENEVLDPRLTALAAVCVCRALEEEGLSCVIKWPNDILTEGKKICGILCEIKQAFCAIGIGINLYQTSFKEFGLDSIATSALQNGIKIEKEKLLYNILDKLDEMLACFDKEINLKKESSYYKYYLAKSFLLGKKINYKESNGEIRTATVIEIDENYRLEVKLISGETAFLDSGEVSLHKN